MNKKERRLALRTALMSRIDDLIIVKDFGATLKVPKTKEIQSFLSRVQISHNAKVLIILSDPSEVVSKSIKNLSKVKLISSQHLNVFDLLNANHLIIGENALSKIQEVYGND